MMGPSHAACGAAAWVALTGTYTVQLADVSIPVGLGLMPVGNAGVITGSLICAGAALLPDLDHPGGTVARSLPPLSGWIAKATSTLSGTGLPVRSAACASRSRVSMTTSHHSSGSSRAATS